MTSTDLNLTGPNNLSAGGSVTTPGVKRRGVRNLGIRSLGIQGRIYAIIALLGAVTIAATALGVSSMHDYHTRVEAIGTLAARALLGEQTDKLVTAVVMDSRGIYMSADLKESEKYSPLLLKSLDFLRQRTTAWFALAPTENRAKFDDAAKRANEFIAFRTELVRLAREVGVPQARTFGDNDANRANRSQLNVALTALVEADNSNVATLAQELEAFYWKRLWLLIALCGAGIVVCSIVAILVVRRGISGPLSLLLLIR